MEKIIKILNKRKRTSANINANDNQMERIKKQIDELEEETRNNFERTNGYKQNVSNLSTNISNISTDVSSLSTTVNTLSENLNTLSGNFSSHVADANQRISNVVGTLADHGTHIMSAEADIIDLQNGKQDALTAGSGISITTNNNVTTISATGGSGGLSTVTASDVDSEQATNGQVLTADGNGGASWQTVSGGGQSGSCDCAEDIAELQNDVEYLKRYVVAPDPYYSGQSFSDYPAGTIVQTYDCYERQLDLSSTGTLNLPKIYFCAETGSESTIKINFDFNVQLLATDVLITIELNNNQICQEVFEVSNINTTYTYTKNFYSQILNTNDKGNNISITISLLGSANNSRTLNVTYFKTEIIAPNADIINKICPFDVISIDNTYYLSDCTNGIAKTATISANDIHNISNVNWINTGIYAQKYKTIFEIVNYEQYTIASKLGYLIQKKDCSYYVELNDNSNITFPNTEISIDWYASYDDTTKYFGITNNLLFRVHTKNANTSSYYSTNGLSGNLVKVIGPRALFNYSNFSYNPISTANITINENGIAFLRTATSTSNMVNLGYATDAQIYLTNYVAYNNYDVEIYLKKYDKIIKKVYHYGSNKRFSFTSELEIGNYDLFFKMPNNDYFVVKNNQLLYYKEI